MSLPADSLPAVGAVAAAAAEMAETDVVEGRFAISRQLERPPSSRTIRGLSSPGGALNSRWLCRGSRECPLRPHLWKK